jgi:hypothetical protein
MYYTHISRGVIDSNRKNGTNDPPICIRKGKYGKASYASEVSLPNGSRIVYDPVGRILPCGARLVITSEEEPIIVE